MLAHLAGKECVPNTDHSPLLVAVDILRELGRLTIEEQQERNTDDNLALPQAQIGGEYN